MKLSQIKQFLLVLSKFLLPKLILKFVSFEMQNEKNVEYHISFLHRIYIV